MKKWWWLEVIVVGALIGMIIGIIQERILPITFFGIYFAIFVDMVTAGIILLKRSHK